ncbi:hypothetical protein [Anderseniella sp. Alg231-50]|uniref:hypothetical protein n=1 Tax=Anderseniella sp. Alg231-50 TaxID=1922226 RepID=UPI000D562D1A
MIATLGDVWRRDILGDPPIGSATLAHLHVPKTAGTSMHHWLEKRLGRRRVFWHDKENNPDIDVIMAERGVEYFRRFAVIGGHIAFTDQSVCALPGPKIFSAVFRRPVEQVVSHFEYVSRRPQHGQHTGGTLEDALSRDTAFLRESTNIQCRFATGSTNAVDALKVIEENPFILGCFDYLPQFIDCVASTLNIPRRGLPRRNVQGPNYFEKHYTPRVAEIIKEITQEDEVIYQRVRKERLICTVHPGADPPRSVSS